MNIKKLVTTPFKHPRKSALAIYIFYALWGCIGDRVNYKKAAREDRAHAEMIAATRVGDEEVAIWENDIDNREYEANCYAWSCDTLFIPKMSYGQLGMIDVLQCKYIFNTMYASTIEKVLDGKIFSYRHGQVGEGHCPLLAMKNAIYAATDGQKDMDISFLAQSLGEELKTLNWYPRFRKMGALIESEVASSGYTTSSVMNPTIKEIETVIDMKWCAVVAVRSLWWYMHRVTILKKVDWKFVIVDSSKRAFDKVNNCIKFVGLNESQAVAMISVWTLELIPEEDLEKMLLHSFAAEDLRARLLKNVSLNTISGAWIYVYPKANSQTFENDNQTFLPLGLLRNVF